MVLKRLNMLLLLITIGVAFQENFASHISIPKHGSYVSSYLKWKSCCQKNDFMCTKGLLKNPQLIIPNAMVCDGTRHCPNGDDEFCMKCPFPTSIPFGNANINGTVFTAGSTVAYQCDEGHMRFGNSMIACQSDGTWTNPPECRRLCAMLPSFPNAVPQSPNPPFLSGSTLIYKCLPNFTRAPGTDSFITCKSGGWWMGTPTCLPNCPVPPMIPNGMPVTMDNEFSVGSVVLFMCDANYAITGPDTVTCQENGAWTKLPECRKLCPEDQLPMPADATPLYGSPPYVVGSIVVYACNDVTQAVAPNNFAICMQDGSWMSDTISCTLQGCSEIPTIEFGKINSIPMELAYGCSVTYTCFVGYALVGPNVTSCLLGGTWSARPTCKQVCPVELPVFEHAFPVSSNPKPPYFESEIIRYECEGCYTLAPGCKNSIRCEDGCWKGEIQCVKECVNALPSIPNASPLEGYSPPYLASDTVVYKCNDGYVMNSCGPNYVTCQADGEWSDEPVCIPDSPLRCPVASACTEPIWSGANQWRLCEGGGQGVCATTKGRLEVFHEDTWRPVCRQDEWYQRPNLLVACRMFGFQHSVATSVFGNFDGQTWIAELECKGNELTLSQCQFQYASACVRDIGIICTNQCTSTI